MVDVRKAGSSLLIRNDSMVNTLQVYRDGIHVVSGDSLGFLKTWDVRAQKCIQTHSNDQTRKPISHIATVVGTDDDEESRYIGVNSYDNGKTFPNSLVLRIWDRGFQHPTSAYSLTHVLKGMKSKNWPIKSSMFYAKEGLKIMKKSNSMELDPFKGVEADSAGKKDEACLVTASGSADPYVFVYQDV